MCFTDRASQVVSKKMFCLVMNYDSFKKKSGSCFLEVFFPVWAGGNGTEIARRTYFNIFSKMKPTVFSVKYIP